MIDFDVHKVSKVGIVGEHRPPARFGKRAAEPKADGSQLIVRLAAVERAVVDADRQRRAFGWITDR